MSNISTNLPRFATTGVAGLQGLALLVYGAGISIIGLTSGLEGPAEVSSPTGAVVEVVTFALFGAGMIAIAVGRWREASWSGPPFVLSQLLALAVGLPLATASDPVGKTIGLLITGSAVVGMVGLVVGALRQQSPEERENPSSETESVTDLRESGRPANNNRG